MLKIRDGKLITTVQNRSNDLHWGLPTNVFQFSFMTEIIAACLGIELGTQTHNSQSLHVYDWNKIAETMLNAESNELYSEVGATERRIDFNFNHEVAGNRLREVDYYLNIIIDNLERISRGADEEKEEIQSLERFSHYLYTVYQYLRIYLKYKAAISVNRDSKTFEAEKAINAIIENASEESMSWDVSILAANWFATKLKEPQQGYLGKL
jgi:small nuclear ribonucleoprotein (snRNP)-like protein